MSFLDDLTMDLTMDLRGGIRDFQLPWFGQLEISFRNRAMSGHFLRSQFIGSYLGHSGTTRAKMITWVMGENPSLTLKIRDMGMDQYLLIPFLVG